MAFLGEAADIPKKNIDVFVDEVLGFVSSRVPDTASALEVLRGTSLMVLGLDLAGPNYYDATSCGGVAVALLASGRSRLESPLKYS